MEKTWMPVVAGILDIVSAAFKLLGVLGVIIAGIVVPLNPYIDPAKASGGVPVNVVALLLLAGIPLVIFLILALVGGIYALQRKKWGLALAGSIAALLPLSILGVAAIILTTLSKNEFE